MKHFLTVEQRRVVEHPDGHHALVIAVPGSGKTSTMAFRVKYLSDKGVPADKIVILMFNKLARAQFTDRLRQLGVDEAYVARVYTFHAFCYSFISRMVRDGFLPCPPKYWVGDRVEEARIYVHRAIRTLVNRGVIAPDSVDIETFMTAVSRWKGELIPPARAGFHGNPGVELVYADFEKLRIGQNALTFDDFVPLVVGLLEAEPGVLARWSSAFDYVAVDEGQDLNAGQQRLVRLVAGNRADVMVVGDPDQCIYEWRGASQAMLSDEFAGMFPNKPTFEYKLSRSFRFGTMIAQTAHNVITRNGQRAPKNLVAHAVDYASSVTVIQTHSGQAVDVEKELVNHIFDCVRKGGDPREVAVLGRTYSQLLGLENELLARGVPYRVIGREPFFARREIRVLVDYMRLGLCIDNKVTKTIAVLLKSVANVPNRRIGHADIESMVDRAKREKKTVREMLVHEEDACTSSLPRAKRESFGGLADILIRIDERFADEPNLTAYEFLIWLTDALNYNKHFEDYYGVGLDSADRVNAVRSFCEVFARPGELTVLEFLDSIAKLDTTQGRPIDEQVIVTTAFKAKGLEYDFVVVPGCVEGAMPCLKSAESPIYDKAGISLIAPTSPSIESERRLFFVAVTRARKMVTIGTHALSRGDTGDSNPPRPSRFIAEMAVEETRSLMPIVADVVAGHKGALDRLVAEFTKTGRISALWTNVRDGYLNGILSVPELKKLSAEIDKLPERVVTDEFPYVDFDEVDEDAEIGDEPKWWEREAV